MKRDQILAVSGTDFKKMTKDLLRAAELSGHIGDRKKRVGIKPNLVCPSPPELGATTHPEIVEGIIEYLREEGFCNIVMAEGAWVGARTRDAADLCGYTDLSERTGVPFIDTKKEKSHPVDCAGMKLAVTEAALDIEFLINVPVLKGHCQTRVTCALKNLKGLLPDSEKRRFHTMGLHKPIAHLSAGIRPDFIVVDHICGDPYFEEGGDPRVTNMILAATDPVLVDSFAARELGINARDVEYIRLAEYLGIGSADLENAEIVDICGAELTAGPSGKGERRILDVSYAVDEVDSCSACYASLVPAIARLEEEGLLRDLPCRIAIGQGHRGKKGKLGVGRCTAGFEKSVPGCPPDEETIYREIREYILSS